MAARARVPAPQLETSVRKWRGSQSICALRARGAEPENLVAPPMQTRYRAPSRLQKSQWIIEAAEYRSCARGGTPPTWVQPRSSAPSEGAKSNALPYCPSLLRTPKTPKRIFFSEGISVSHLFPLERKAHSTAASAGQRRGVVPREPQGSSERGAYLRGAVRCCSSGIIKGFADCVYPREPVFWGRILRARYPCLELSDA